MSCILSFFLRKKFWIKDFFKGSPMWKAFKEVTLIAQNTKEGELLRKKRLNEFLSFVTSNTVYYKGKKYNSLLDFPVIDKKIILDNYSSFTTPAKLIPGQIGPIHVQKTSGSTGTPFEIPQDTRCRTRRIATIKVANELIGFHSFEPMMHLRAIKHYWNMAGEMIWNKDLQILYVDNANLTEKRVEEIIKAINEYKIKVVRGYMTTIDTITRYALEHNINLDTKPTFISVGELLLESLRLRIIMMGCKVISQYGNEENGILGQSEFNGSGSNIILNRANCYIEILKMDRDEPVGEDELGRIVVTDFSNYAMPMIRYEIGDLAMIDKVSESGEILSIKNLSGRKTDLIYRTDGTCVDIFNSIPAEIYNNPCVRQWQFIQKDRSYYQLNLCVSNESVKADEENFIKLLEQILGDDAIVDVFYKDEIPVLSSGKRKVVINEWKKL